MPRTAMAVHDETEYAVVDVATDITTVYNGPALLFGICVNTTLSAHVLPITDGTSGSTVVSLAASAAAGTWIYYPGIRFLTALVVNPNDAATGNITVAYRPYNVDVAS